MQIDWLRILRKNLSLQKTWYRAQNHERQPERWANHQRSSYHGESQLNMAKFVSVFSHVRWCYRWIFHEIFSRPKNLVGIQLTWEYLQKKPVSSYSSSQKVKTDYSKATIFESMPWRSPHRQYYDQTAKFQQRIMLNPYNRLWFGFHYWWLQTSKTRIDRLAVYEASWSEDLVLLWYSWD